ncbi:hypothetical protein Y900_028090 [Mycolicibacterium aromaticivorans JS19b1 = JCM 16368]|uniref:Uncharacterized protein n=1 Tax=Mycolicibacterium aromaticivorans JS19b1 = JCM 16368 TaxID=1440774 RepID=A0A064CEJ9_9MYCO|nr:hypothetical protein [Mycolicibacterium aromaticivorans]KDE97148.1 hypothetical protein Y900_028090 [Mycolicibacterium aromaticivorans JS19b1 = JCM 16368]
MTTPPTVSATAVPISSGPAKLPAAATASACTGVAARVATSAATEFAESWKPLVMSNTTAMPIVASRIAVPIAARPYGRLDTGPGERLSSSDRARLSVSGMRCARTRAAA